MQTEWNPKWLAFLSEKGLTTQEADAMERPDRISLNAEFMCFTRKPFDKAKWQREYMKEYRAGKRRKPSPPKPSIQSTTEERND